jgi:ribosomal protein S18 acetylase RimI-like enzyme
MTLVRQATVLDVAAIGRIEVETWRETYPGVLPDKLLIGLSPRQRARSWTAYVARSPADILVATAERGAVVGFGNCGAQRGAVPGLAGEIFTLYVAPEHQGRGIGRQLLMGLFRRLVRSDLPSAVVWVLAQNPSRFFYERTGGSLVARRNIDVGGARVDAVAYAWRDLRSVIRAQAGTDGRLSE